ncbi:MAG: hypothetical protein QNK15_04945 [Cycloclasticus sp.]|nr:hypothetical protein [Cycloclasticus sp.]
MKRITDMFIHLLAVLSFKSDQHNSDTASWPLISFGFLFIALQGHALGDSPVELG